MERVIVKNCLSARNKNQSNAFLLPWWEHDAIHWEASAQQTGCS